MKGIVSVILICSCACSTFELYAQEAKDIEPYEDVSYIIIYSSKDLRSATEFATTAAQKLNWKLDTQRFYVDSTDGEKVSGECCHGEGKEDCHLIPYLARGRFDHGNYISVEHSSVYTGFSPNLYFVIAASYPALESDSIQSSYQKLKPFFPDAYIKSQPVYYGCLH